ncbi:MAG: aldehyde dehydrogenase family protein [Dehalococcoidia bacterium]|nr:aldehyde dehydrogenase family protein [Dehalococcoidia bacterium]MDH4299516.1 aldehyde dehydrogenase family protein [Dehalococcoidia bacterium]MDH4366844.1 aldehyde dehydrogenase family protein [Dehalococcoidia bacterium]
MCKAYQMYINGQWLDAIDGKTFDDYNPYNGEVYAKLPSGKRGDARKACDAAAAAFPDWSHTPPAERQRFFLRAADILERRQQEIVNIVTQETGGTFGWGMFQTSFVPGLLREAAAQVHAVSGEIIPADLPGALFMAIRQPVGVVAGIAPWNAPLILSLRAVALPMACGNTTVLKPSAEAPVSGGIVFAEVFEEAGFPRGVFNVVTNGPGFSEEVGDELIEHPKVRRLSFTGSTEVGRQIAEKAARHLKKVTLELGGNDPLIILKDADVDYAVNAATFGRFNHQGQVCMSSKRIIVEKPLASQFTEKFVEKVRRLKVGDPQERDTVIGPLINQKQVDKLHKQVEEAIKQGGRVVCGGKYDGRCYYPTVLTNVTPDMNIAREETFGPVAPIIIVEDADEAVRVANDSRFGLSAGVITSNFQKGLDIAERLESGMVHINDSTIHDEPQVPFGGMKESGYGRHGGRAAIEEFTELRWITIQRTPRQYPF